MSDKGQVAVIGVGCSKFGDRIDAGLTDLFVEAYQEAMNDVDKGLDLKEIQEAYIGCYGASGEQIGNLSAMLLDHVGLTGIPSTRVENACATGGYAFRAGVSAILSGMREIVLVGGVEKMQDVSGNTARLWLGGGADTQWERWHGLTFAGVFALQASRYMHEYGLTREQLASVAVKNHANGSENPKAHFQQKITIDNVINSPVIAHPLRLYDCCPTSDGGAVAILCKPEIARKFTDLPIYVVGFGAATDRIASFHRPSITTFPATTRAAKEAYEMAEISPKDVDLVELHDCFTIAEIVLTEDLGLCEKGTGGKFIEEGQTQIGGTVSVNSSGGLKAKGHPIGATGVGQIYEIVNQLRGKVEKRSRQVPNAEIGLAHIQGGFGVTVAIHILKR